MKKTGKRLVAGILTAVSLFGAIAFTGCDETANKNEAANNTPSVSEPTTPSTPQYDGTIVQAGGKYNLSNKIAFLSSDIMTTSGEVTPVSVTLTATVTPADANQAVNWRVSFVNAGSEWASGKTVTDYVTITTETEGSTSATVTCSAPFGEPIKIECISQDNPDIKAECTVDLLQGIENVSLTFGTDFPINLGGQTDVVWELNPNGTGKGGAANVVIDTYDTYTVALDYTTKITLTSPSVYYNGDDWDSALSWGRYYEETIPLSADPSTDDDYFRLGQDLEISVDCGLVQFEEITSLTFDNAFLQSSMAAYTEFLDGGLHMRQIYFYELSTTEMISRKWENPTFSNVEVGFGHILEGSLYTLQLTVTGETAKDRAVRETYNSLLYLTGYTNKSNVQSVTLDKSEIVF